MDAEYNKRIQDEAMMARAQAREELAKTVFPVGSQPNPQVEAAYTLQDQLMPLLRPGSIVEIGSVTTVKIIVPKRYHALT